jgi:starch synthase
MKAKPPVTAIRAKRAASEHAPKRRVRPKVSAETAPRAPILHVAMASPEIVPFAKTGGLGDVMGSLPQALEQLGIKVTLIMPAYRSVLRGGFQLEDTGIKLAIPISTRREEVTLLRSKTGKNIPVYFVRNDRYFDREYLYSTPEGDYLDNAERFIVFSRAVLEVLKLDPPAILQSHDWQAALSIVFLKTQPHLYPELSRTKTICTVHNLGYQGLFWHLDWHLLNLDWSLFTPTQLEFYSRINFLKGGLVFADFITTVSPSYAEEIKTVEQGFGLHGIFRERAANLAGILNGADYDVWNPETDKYIARKYGPGKLAGKKACKAELQRTFKITEAPNTPLIGMVSRLTAQKGFDLLEKAMEQLMSRDLQFVLLGTGDKQYQEFLTKASAKSPDRMGVRIEFDEALSHKIIAGADMLLLPSRYEPSGLTQIYGLKYGTVPVVRATGGLKDTIEEFDPKTGKGNGFVFVPYEVQPLLDAVDRALAAFRDKKAWAALMQNAMAADFSWDRSAQTYLELYKKLVAGT